MKLNINKTILLIIDVQNDFCPGGTLAVNNGDEVVKPLNELAKAISSVNGRVAVTQDWHPVNHISFASSHKDKNIGDTIDTELVKGQVLWPEHCVQGTNGADFHKDLNSGYFTMILRKGFRKKLDSYSAFFENDRETSTGLEGWLKTLEIENVIIGGLATDYCVFYSAMDSKNSGFKTIIASDAVRGVGFPEGSVESAVKTMKSSGIEFQTTAELIKNIPSL
jgi:nicotinamidase/pyrazinamidase